MHGVRIAGMGIALPERIVTNADIAAMYQAERARVLASGVELTPEEYDAYETNDEWIVSRTGIHTRRFAEPHETTSDYAARAADAAWTDAYGDGLTPPDFLILGTVSPDHPQTPPTSVVTLRKLAVPAFRFDGTTKRLRRCAAMDVSFACTTPIAALSIGCAFIQSGAYQRGLVVLADLMSRTTGKHHRARSPFFILADAGAAYVLEACAAEHSWFRNPPVFLGGDGGPDGCNENRIKTLAGGAAVPLVVEHLDPRRDDHLMFMDGNRVMRDIVPLVANRVIPDLLDFFQTSMDEVDVIIPHQANNRMTMGVLERLVRAYPHIDFRLASYVNPKGTSVSNGDTPKTHTVVWYDNIDHLGNTTSPATALCTYEAVSLAIIRPGTRVLQVAFGGGYTEGGTLITWGA